MATFDGYVLGDQSIECSIEDSGHIYENGGQEGVMVEKVTKNDGTLENEKNDADTINRGIR